MSRLLLATAALITAFAIPSIAAVTTFDTTTGNKSQIEHKSLKTFDAIEEAKRNRKRKGRNRVPGGSGCDSPEDIAEHSECTPTETPAAAMKNKLLPDLIQDAKRRKKCQPGGSGCDSAQDIAEHPECTPQAPA